MESRHVLKFAALSGARRTLVEHAPFDLKLAGSLKLRVLLDKSIFEVFAKDRE